MASTFHVLTRDVAPASSGTPETLFTVQGSTRIVIIGLTLCNVHSASITVSVTLVSTTTQTGQTQNTTANITKDLPIPAGSTFEVMGGNKLNANAGDIIKVDASVADKVSVTLSYMLQT
jgi:hypothetical protein